MAGDAVVDVVVMRFVRVGANVYWVDPETHDLYECSADELREMARELGAVVVEEGSGMGAS